MKAKMLKWSAITLGPVGMLALASCSSTSSSPSEMLAISIEKP